MAQSGYYQISDGKLSDIADIVQAHMDATFEQVEDFVLADWAEGAAHQAWLHEAPAAEIADWVIAGLPRA